MGSVAQKGMESQEESATKNAGLFSEGKICV